MIRTPPNRRGASAGNCRYFSLSVWKKVKIVNPKPISASEVRTIAINVRSVANAVRSNAIAVRLEASSVLASPPMSLELLSTSWAKGLPFALELSRAALSRLVT